MSIHTLRSMVCAFFFLAILAFTSGCQTSYDDGLMDAYAQIEQGGSRAQSPSSRPPSSESLILREGDVLNITFPGAPELNTIQQIRRDGKITIQLVGEMNAVGMSPVQLEKEILRLCGPQLVNKEVRVMVDSSSFPVFVTGAVLRPGKIMSDRPINALQAIMEAGGFDYSKANLTAVRVIRQEGEAIKNYQINLKLPLQGKPSDPFPLKPADIVFVPEKFSWF